MIDATDSAAPIHAKADPETLALRGRPRRVVRFRRDVIMGLAAFSVAGTVVVAWLALRPTGVNAVPTTSVTDLASATAPSETLEGMPASYADVPELGSPPTFGGRSAPFSRDGNNNAAANLHDAESKALKEERKLSEAEERAARASALMIDVALPVAEGPVFSYGDQHASQAPAWNLESHPLAKGDARTRSAVGPADGESDDVNPHRLAAPSSPYLVQAGSVIAASLLTGLNSELPGLVTAQVTQNVHDSLTGRTLLIPQGSRLIGRYDDVVALGQKRALVVWQRLIFPDGYSLAIDDMPASDARGFAGLSDRVDRHEGAMLKGVALATLLGVGTEIGWGDDESLIARAIRDSAQDSGSRAGDQIVRRNLDVQPTLVVRPGWAFRIIVHKDLILPPWNAAGPAF